MVFQPQIIIFIPNFIPKSGVLYLYGDVEYSKTNKAVVFYVFEVCDTMQTSKPCVGVWSDGRNLQKVDTTNSVILTTNLNGQLELQRIKFEGKDLLTKCVSQNLVIIYSASSFSIKNFVYDRDCVFTKLQTKILNQRAHIKKQWLWLPIFVFIFQFISRGFTKVMPLLKYSTIGMQLKITNERFLWAFESIKSHEKESIKIHNFFLSVLLDIILGIFSLKLLLIFTSTEDFPDLFLWTSENCVTSLKNLLNWLRGSPAGFKLNREFNNILARFFLFHTDIWWLFLVYISPGLGVAFQIFTFLGQFGLTFQAAILSDILGLVSFHAYCIYAYAARLYNLQLSGLISLWRLILGRKWNPLREKVDSCHYSADQLFVGTLVFTILLFLLPTTLVYYIVFTTSRLLIVGIGRLLTRVRLFLHAVPVCSSLLWLLSAPSVSLRVRVGVDAAKSTEELIVLRACRVPDSFMATVQKSIPDCIQAPPSSSSHLLSTLLMGKLLYPL